MSYRNQIAAALVVSMAAASATAGDRNETARKRLPVAYCLYDLGRLPGLPPGETSISVTDISNRNQVVGWNTLSGGFTPLRPFIWDRVNGMRELSHLPDFPNTSANAINTAGTIVGDANELDTGDGRAVIWPAGGEIQVLDASLGGVRTYAADINRSGQIVGASEITPGSALAHAFLREPDGDVLDLGAFPEGDGYSGASAVNNRGWVVGASNGSFSTEAFIWDKRNGMRRLLENPGTTVTFAADINNRGEVVGERLAEGSRAFRWTRKTGMQDIGALSGVDTDYATATSINRWGHIVGASQIETAGPAHAFVWSRRSGMLNLNQRIHSTSPLANVAVLVIAQAINDGGWIVADGFIPDDPDPQRSFVLVPRRRAVDAACP